MSRVALLLLCSMSGWTAADDVHYDVEIVATGLEHPWTVAGRMTSMGDGDELNVIEPGRNYGWPLISYGRDYSRAAITPFTELPTIEQPRAYWIPPQWRGSLFVAAVPEESVRRVPLDALGGVAAGPTFVWIAGRRAHGHRVADAPVAR